MNWLSVLSLIAQAPAAPEAAPAPPSMGPMLLILMVFMLYFFMIAPQRKRQKETERMLSSVKKGDRVIFGGGIYGTVVGITDEKPDESNPRAPKVVLLTIEVDKNTKLTVRRESVSAVLSE